VRGRRVLEGEAVKRQPGSLANLECAVFDRLVDVRAGCGDPIPADRVHQDELVAGVSPMLRRTSRLTGAPPSFA